MDISGPRGDAAPFIHTMVLAREARFDGVHGVWTNFDNMPAAVIRQRYGERWTIEHGIRALQTDLGIRLVFRWTERHVLSTSPSAWWPLRFLAASAANALV